MALYTYWAVFGTFYLMLLTYQDIKNNMKIDDRRNAFMLGMTISLINFSNKGFFYIVVLAFVLGFLNMFLRKIKAMGVGDINSFSWIFLGFGLIDPFLLAFFCLWFSLLMLFYIFLKNVVFKYSKPVAFFIVILASFVTTSIIFKIY